MQTTNADLCENYQLKWSSYNSYIHSCIASSLINDDSYADVALVTMDGHKIMTHRFILSYASQYLNKALKFQPKVTSALPLMIVLPQAITYKALKILVKYMYSGETTVPKDILNVVLKAGDILKIKGLYREQPGTNASDAEEKLHTKNLLSKSNGGQFGDADSLLTLNNDCKENVGLSTSSSIGTATNHVSPQLYVNSNTSSSKKLLQNQIDTTKTNLEQTSLYKPTKIHHKSPSSLKSCHKGQKVLNFTMPNCNGSMEKENNASTKAISLNKKVTQQQHQQSDKPHTITSAEAAAAAAAAASSELSTSTSASAIINNDNLLSSTTALNNNNDENDDDDDDDDDDDRKSNIADVSDLVIKNEPLEFPEESTDHYMDIVNDDKVLFAEEIVKTEAFDDSASNDEESQSDLYTPLACELCTASFTIPAEWVKHVQTHTDMLPAKRRRRDSPEIEDDNGSYPQLQCDLCEKSFPTPAEWVHHIQDTHTEFELSLFNRRSNQMKKNDLNKYKFVVN